MFDFFVSLIVKLLSVGLVYQAVAILVIFIIGFFGYKYRHLFLKEKISLLNHSIFCNLKEYDINFYQNSNDTKKVKAVKRYVKCYISHFEEWLKINIANDKEWNTEKIIESYQKMITDIEYCWIADQAPFIFINKWREYNKTSNEMMLKYITQASESDFYTEDISKKILILTISQVIFFASLRDIDHIVASLNGELDKLYND